MADTQEKLSIATLGTREDVQKIVATVPITGAAEALGSVAVTFDKAFVSAPKILGVNGVSIDLAKANLSISTLTASGMYVNIYRYALADLANGSYGVEVNLVGWKVS
jgi:hypothetical protein